MKGMKLKKYYKSLPAINIWILSQICQLSCSTNKWLFQKGNYQNLNNKTDYYWCLHALLYNWYNVNFLMRWSVFCLLYLLTWIFFMHEINERIFIYFCSLIFLLCKMNVQFNKSHFTQLTALVLVAFWSVELLWLNTTKIVDANYSKAVLTPRPETCFSWLIPVCKHFLQCHEQIQGWSYSYLLSQNMTMPTLFPIL